MSVTLIRKLIVFIFVFSFSVQLAAATENEDRISFNLRNVPLKTVINHIEKQTNYLFVYDEQVVDINLKVTINAKNNTVEEILNNLISGTELTYSIEGKNIVLRKKQLRTPATDDSSGKVGRTGLSPCGPSSWNRRYPHFAGARYSS